MGVNLSQARSTEPTAPVTAGNEQCSPFRAYRALRASQFKEKQIKV